MDRKEFSNRRADQISLEQSKKQLWNHIQRRIEKKPKWYQVFGNYFKGHKFSFAGSFMAILVIALVSYNLNFSLFKSQVVRASFEMQAVQQDSTGVDPQTDFILQASEDLSPGIIEENLKVEPSIDFKVKEIKEGQYQVIPNENLEANVIYHFSIQSVVQGKPQEFSWAYQVQDNFKILSTLPGDKTANVPLNVALDIHFSHENFDFKSIKDFFEIQPQTQGRFEKHQKTLSFVPTEPLKAGVVYTVQIKKGLKLSDSDKRLTQDFVFQFETQGDRSNSDSVRFAQGYYEIGEDKPLGFNVYVPYSSDEKSNSKVNVKIFQFPNEQAYQELLLKRAEVPSWAEFLQTSPIIMDTSKLKPLGEVEAIVDQANWQNYIYLPTSEFKAGFYLFEIPNHEVDKSQALVQVTNLSAFVDVTETKTIFWVNDVRSRKPVQGAEVQVINRGKLGATNKEGLDILDTPDYLADRTSTEIVKIRSGNDVLFHAIQGNSYSQKRLGSHYWSSLTTDRPVYKPTDKVNFWGFLKPKDQETKVTDLTLKLTDGTKDSLLEQMPLKLSDDGFFKGKFELNQLPPGYYTINLYQADELILSNYLTVQVYDKPPYQIDIKAEKQAVFAGEKMNFDVMTQFFDGTPVPQLKLNYSDTWANKEVQTDSEGKLKLQVEAQPVSNCSDKFYCSNSQNYNLSLAPAFAEKMDLRAETWVSIFNSKMALYGSSEVKDHIAHLALSSHGVDLQKYLETGDELGETIPHRTIKGVITELQWKTTQTGEYYDFINKKVEKTYNYEQVEVPAGSFEVQTNEEGKATYDFKINPKSYYQIMLSAEDNEGKKAYNTVYVYGEKFSRDYDTYNINLNSTDQEQRTRGQTLFDIGQTVKAQFSKGSVSLPPDAKGSFLFFQSSNGLKDYAVQNSPHYEFKFKKEDIPNVLISGVWFTGQNYWVAEGVNAGYQKELKKLSVQVQADKPKYQPGDEVQLDVEVKDLKGKPVSAEVNLNLVDEAYYEVIYDALSDPLNDIYQWADSGELYQYDTHRNPLFNNAGGDKGGCFVAGTQILMADGTYKDIESIRKGDLILTKKTAYSPEMVPAKVLSTISHQVTDYLVLNENLKVTKEHILFVNGQFNQAGEIKKGDQLLNKNHQWVDIQSIREIQEKVMVYNFQVENQHTYFANDFYVHNDKGGDITRTDFKDNALFESVQTDFRGKATVKFKLPDNITSWRVAAKAIDPENLQAGMGTGEIAVGLPFFADLIVNQEYSVKDQPQFKFRAYGDQLKEGDKVDFQIKAPTLELDQKVQSKAFEGAYATLPQLQLGRHSVLLKAQSGKLKDALKLPVQVVDSRLYKDVVEFIPEIKSDQSLKLDPNKVNQVTFVDEGRGGYYATLQTLYYLEGNRLDQKLAVLGSLDLLEAYFKEKMPEPKFEALNYQSSNGGLRLLPYADDDLELTVLTLLFDGHSDRFNQANLKHYLYEIYQDKKANLSEIVLALSGLAALDEPVLTSLHLIENEKTLRLEDRLYLAWGMYVLGEVESAKAIFYKEFKNFNSWKTDSATRALAAALAANLDEPEAEMIWQSALKAQRGDEYLNFYELAYLKGRLKFAESNPVKFIIDKNGKNTTVNLEKGRSYSALFLPNDQVKIKVLSGQLAATVYYALPQKIQDFKNQPGLAITRSYSILGKPEAHIQEGDIVKVTLKVEGGESIDKNQSFDLTDILPSGLTPITTPRPYLGSLSEEEIAYPYEINGQAVRFYWHPENKQHQPNSNYGTDQEVFVSDTFIHVPEPNDYETQETFTYLARVVNPGKFYADPAKIQSEKDSTAVSISEENWIEIRRAD